ncbi:hypothetical protein [Spongiactinospora gelatinilytica]|uniref:hypothetical protein n=1 Tax=Spongiactinospora gelatinilytica TaxID=2666298 RepID=UPI001314086E|nr:hypothetical protein [Spongiactinospora gelatinilytica]
METRPGQAGDPVTEKLYRAAVHGDAEAVRALLAEGADRARLREYGTSMPIFHIPV